MGERNIRLIKHIIAGWDHSWICRRFGLKEKELQWFIERNGKRITFAKLKHIHNESKPARVIKTNRNRAFVNVDDEGTHISIK